MITERTLYSWVLAKNLRWQLLLILLVLLTVVARVVPLEMQKRIINRAIGLGKVDLLITYCLIFIAAVLTASALKFAINFLQSYVGQKTLQRMREELYAHILSLPLAFFRTIQPGQVINALVNELATVAGFIGSAVSVPLINVATLLAMGGYLFYLHPLLAGLCFVLYPLQIVVVPKLQKRMNEANRHRVKVSRDLSGNIGEVLAGIHEVHGHAGHGLETDRFSTQARSLLGANVRMNAYRYGIKFANNLFENFGPFILFLIGGLLTIRGRFDLGALVAFLSAYTSLNEPWRELMDFYQLLEDSRVRYKAVMASFARKPEDLLTPVDRDVYRLNGSIHLQDVVCYAPDGAKLLDNIELQVSPGEALALVGFSGSGKSTLLQVAAKLLSASTGSVRIGDREVRELSKVDVADNLGMVPQHPFIFSGSLRDNLLYSCLAAARNRGHAELPDLDRLIETAQQIGFFPDILKFGIQSILDGDQHHALIARILAVRPLFRARFGEEHGADIEFFDRERYLEFGSIAQNIVFGDFPDRRARFHKAFEHKGFLTFLGQNDLMAPLLEFGRSVTLTMVPILRFAAPTRDLFEESPIAREEVDAFVALAAALIGKDTAELKSGEKELLLKAALAFIPGRHKGVAFPEALRQRILAARHQFRDFSLRLSKAPLNFYDQEHYILSRSVRENILFGQAKGQRSGAVEEIDQHLVQLLIEEQILEPILDRGLDFQVGSMGENLSGGQRQKIALARVLLKKPAIYLLDEATSALDNASQARVQKHLQSLRGRHTVLAVVHRLDTLAAYDRIAVMKSGKIIEIGTYNHLMATRGALYELVGRT